MSRVYRTCPYCQGDGEHHPAGPCGFEKCYWGRVLVEEGSKLEQFIDACETAVRKHLECLREDDS